MTFEDSEESLAEGAIFGAAGRLGEEFAWPASKSAPMVNGPADSGRAILGGEIWVLWTDGPLYGIPRLSKTAPVYGLLPFLDPKTEKYSGIPGVYAWSSELEWVESTSWSDYCQSTARETLTHLAQVEALRVQMVPKVRDKLWLNLVFVIHAEAGRNDR